MSAIIAPEVLAFIAKVGEALAAMPAGEWAGGSLYVGDVPVRWSSYGVVEEFGHFTPNEFEGYDFVAEFKEIKK